MSGPSIKAAMNGDAVAAEKVSSIEQHNLYSRQDLFEPYSEEQVLKKWKEFLATLDDRPNLKSTLSRGPVIGDGNMLVLQIDNHVQDDLVRDIKPQLVSWLRRELRNSGIDLVTEIKAGDNARVAYTDGEKFEEMLRKNPDLAMLRQKFNLDFDE